MKVNITIPRGQEASRIVVDDVDITKYVLREGFSVDVLGKHDDYNMPTVTLTLRPDVLDLELDDPEWVATFRERVTPVP